MAPQPTPSHSEIVDIVDLYGVPTGEYAPKADAHQKGLWHRDTHVWITDGTHLLQQHRAPDKDIMPGQFDISVSGHVNRNETYFAAACREVEEEIGLDMHGRQLTPIGTLAIELSFPGWAVPHRVVSQNYVLFEPELSLEDLTLQKDEVQGVRLYPIDLLEEDLRHPETARNHAEQPLALWQLGIGGMRRVLRQSRNMVKL